MKISRVVVLLCCFSVILLAAGCGQGQGQGGGPSGGDEKRNPTVGVAQLFDVTGAKAIATASSAQTTTGSAIRAFQAANVTELLKLDAG